MATIASLSVTVDAPRTAAFDSGMRKVDRKVEASRRRMNGFSESSERMANSTRNATRTLSEEVVILSRFGGTMGGVERIMNRVNNLHEAGQISATAQAEALANVRNRAIELRQQGLEPMGSELESFNSVMKATGGPVAKQGVRGIGTLRRSMGSLAARALGLNGRIGTVVSTLSGLAIPALTTAGILGGIAALGLAFKKFREEAEESAEKVKEFLSSFDPLQSQIGQFANLEAARDRLSELREELRLLRLPTGVSGAGGALGLGPMPGEERGVPTTGEVFRAQRIEQEIQQLERAIQFFEGQLGPGGSDSGLTGAASRATNALAEFAPTLDQVITDIEFRGAEAFAEVEEFARLAQRRGLQVGLPTLGELGEGGLGMEFVGDEARAAAGQGGLDLQPLKLDRINRQISIAAGELEGVGDEASKAAQVAIAGFGSVVEAFARGADNMVQIAVTSFTKIAQSLTDSGPWGAVIGAVGGLVGGLLSRANRPAPVRVEDYSSQAQRQMKDANQQPVIRNVLALPDGTIIDITDEDLRDVMHRMERLRRKGGIPRG